MIATVVNIFRIQDLRNKILFTVALLIIYRVGFHIPVPCYDQSKIADITKQRDTEGPLGRAAEYMQMFRWNPGKKQLIWPGNYALYYLVDYPYAAGRGHPGLEEATPGRPNRPQKNTGVHTLLDRADMRYSIDNVYEVVGRGRIDLSGYGASGHDNGYCRYDGRHRLSDVAWRADR
jgi:hypothetical protein